MTNFFVLWGFSVGAIRKNWNTKRMQPINFKITPTKCCTIYYPKFLPPSPLKSFRKQMDIIKINTQTHVCSQLCSQYSSFEQTVTWSTLMSLWHEHACERHMLTTVAKKQICFAFMLWMNYVTVLSIRTNFPTCPYRLNTYEQKNIQFFSQYL